MEVILTVAWCNYQVTEMTVIADIRVSAEHFSLAEPLAAHPGMTIRFESVVPIDDTHIPFLWVDGHDLEALRSDLTSDDAVDSVSVLETLDGKALLKIEWADPSFPLSTPLNQTDGAIIEGSGDAETFRFSVRFPDDERLSAFFEASRNAGCPITLDRLHGQSQSTEPDPGEDLTDLQRETIKTAFEMGYFSVPREANLLDVANRLGVSDTATSQRLRRGLTVIINSMFEWDPD